MGAMKIKFFIPGTPRTKKNSGRVTRSHMVLPSKAYIAYEDACSWLIPKEARLNISVPTNCKTVFYMPTSVPKVDLPNLINAIHDILVKNNVYKDDNSNIICSVDGSKVVHGCDKKDTGVLIEIEVL